MNFQSIKIYKDYIEAIDQRFLPHSFKKVKIQSLNDTCHAISEMVIRGAPLIGVVAAYGFYFATKNYDNLNGFTNNLEEICSKLINTRPTAVNLLWSVNRMESKFKLLENKNINFSKIKSSLKKEADEIYYQDVEMCYQIGLNTEKYIESGYNILTHCNAGSLATSKYGTALSGIYIANRKYKNLHVWVDETRPWLQGARLTTWELTKNGVKNTLIVDSTAGFLMKDNKVDLVIVGADRIAKNGDVANKIGTYMLSVLAKENNIPFIVAAPTSTVDKNIKNGNEIEIEKRPEKEIKKINKEYITSKSQKVFNPVFDVTPFENIDHIITEKGEFIIND